MVRVQTYYLFAVLIGCVLFFHYATANVLTGNNRQHGEKSSVIQPLDDPPETGGDGASDSVVQPVNGDVGDIANQPRNSGIIVNVHTHPKTALSKKCKGGKDKCSGR